MPSALVIKLRICIVLVFLIWTTAPSAGESSALFTAPVTARVFASSPFLSLPVLPGSQLPYVPGVFGAGCCAKAPMPASETMNSVSERAWRDMDKSFPYRMPLFHRWFQGEEDIDPDPRCCGGVFFFGLQSRLRGLPLEFCLLPPRAESRVTA